MSPAVIISRRCTEALVYAFLFLMASAAVALAHPEDDFCGPDMGVDMQLCAQLSALNSERGDVPALWRDDAGDVLSGPQTFIRFSKIGIGHILPGGTDHILFVIALVLAAQRLGTLVLHISAFTLAHTATLGLAASDVINPPPEIVEPLIAASIAYVAVENIAMRQTRRWRPLVVFGFGLLHGLGFAGFVRSVGLPPEQFWTSLLGFNVGVEIGQLGVVLVTVMVCRLINRAIVGSLISYRQATVVPCSILIAAIGLWWALSRAFGA